jgi:hypothetical protein
VRTELDCGQTYQQSRPRGATELSPALQRWEDRQESFKSRGTAQREYELKSKRTFGFHVLLLNRMQSVPECKPARDDQSNENADQKKPAISGERYQQDRYYGDRDHEARRSPQAESRPSARFRLHDFILAAAEGCLERALLSAAFDFDGRAPPTEITLLAWV